MKPVRRDVVVGFPLRAAKRRESRSRGSCRGRPAKDVDDPTDIEDALRAAEPYGALGDAFQQGKMLLRTRTGQLTHDGPDGERVLREALAVLQPFGNTKTLARS